jgi:chromosome segregation ATPase
MRVSTILKGSMLVAGLCLMAWSAVAQQDSSQQSTGDPVADAARRARAKQKDEPKPKKVFTDDDVKPATDTTAKPTTPAAGDAATAEVKKSPDGKDGGGKNSESEWRKKFAEQRNKIATAEKELDVLQRESEKAQVEYYPDPQKALMEQNTRKDINDLNKKIDDKKTEIAKLKQGLDDLEDALRKAGGEPGWAN